MTGLLWWFKSLHLRLLILKIVHVRERNLLNGLGFFFFFSPSSVSVIRRSTGQHVSMKSWQHIDMRVVDPPIEQPP